MSLNFKSIAIGARSESRNYIHQIALELKEKYGSVIHLYCSSEQEKKHYQSANNGAYDTINISDFPIAHAFDKIEDQETIIERARYYEDLTGLTINRMIVPDRHFGRGYALAGVYHPRSRYSENVDYIHAVNGYVCTLEYWEKEIDEKKISLIVNCPREAAYISKVKNVPYRALISSRIENYHYWAWTEMYESPLFEDVFKTVEDDPDAVLTAPYWAHSSLRPRYMKSFSFWRMVKAEIHTVAQHWYWLLRGYQKAKGYYLKENVLLHYRRWHQYRKLMKMKLFKFDELKPSKIVYFPLHVEPETALHGISPEYFFQLELISTISRDLPAGVTLAVKEAYGSIGRRPSQFYRQIADLKNVRILDPWELGIKCAQESNVVVTICGTAGLEAISAGVPVIAFGQHNLYNFLEAVRTVSQGSDVKAMLQECLDGNFSEDDIRSQARRLVKSVKMCSFDMEKYDYIDLDSFSKKSVEAGVENLRFSLENGVSEDENSVY